MTHQVVDQVLLRERSRVRGRGMLRRWRGGYLVHGPHCPVAREQRGHEGDREELRTAQFGRNHAKIVDPAWPEAGWRYRILARTVPK